MVLNFAYQSLLKPLLFRVDPETAHEWSLACLSQWHWMLPALRSFLCLDDPRFEQTIWGLSFKNPIGLAAGFDKNAKGLLAWQHFGFGFVEVGTITPQPQPGNPKPRLFRYPQQQALVNRMGFNNDGAEAVAQRLKTFSSKWMNKTAGIKQGTTTERPIEHATESTAVPPAKCPFVIGVSLGKQAATPVDDISAVTHDYTTTLEQLYALADFFVVNVSSPNTVNLRDLQSINNLRRLLEGLTAQMERCAGGKPRKPLLLKIAPDLEDQAIIDLTGLAKQSGIHGIIATNTTNQTGDLESGGLSGAPLRQRSTQVIRLIAEHTGGELPIIGVGGIFNADDAIEKLHAGAWLLQLYTGFVYQGPSVVKQILRGLQSYMDNNHITQIAGMRE